MWLWERLRLSGQVPHQRVPAGTLCQYFAGGSRGSSQKTIGEAASRCPPQGVSGTSLAQSTREGPCNTVSMHKLKRLFIHLWERLPAGILLGVIAQWGRPRSSEPHAGDKNKRGGGSGTQRNKRRRDAQEDHGRKSHPEKGRKDSSSQDSARRKPLASNGAKAASKCPMTGCKADLCQKQAFRDHVPSVSQPEILWFPISSLIGWRIAME